jgi:hypothetical protein
MSQALVTSRQRSERHLQNILHSTRGIIFLGTPHHGAGLARWAELLSRSIGLVKQTNSKIVEVLKRDSEVLARIQDSFHTLVMARSGDGLPPIEISCFYEELPLPGVGLVGHRQAKPGSRSPNTDPSTIGRATRLGYFAWVHPHRNSRQPYGYDQVLQYRGPRVRGRLWRVASVD